MVNSSRCIVDYCYGVNCEKGNCEGSFKSYSCSCAKGAKNFNETNSQSMCVTDYCYDVDCKNGECKNSLNNYTCQCDSGLGFKD